MRMDSPARYSRPRGLEGLIVRPTVAPGRAIATWGMSGLAGLSLPSEAEIVQWARANTPGGFSNLSDAEVVSHMSGGMGRRYAPWVFALDRQIGDLTRTGGDRNAARGMVIKELRGSVISGAGPGSTWWAQIPDFVKFRSSSTGHPGLETDPYIQSEVALLADYVQRYQNPADLEQAIMGLGVFDAYGRYPATPLGQATGTWGNMTPQTPEEIIASGSGSSSGSGSASGGNGSGSSTGSGPASSGSTNAATAGSGPLAVLTSLPIPVIAAGVIGAYFLFKGGR